MSMHELTGVARSASRQERRYRRFKLRDPVHLVFRSGELVCEVDAVSRNVSIGGLLLECPVPIPQDSAVNFIISLRAQTLRPLDLVGEGKVVRMTRSTTGAEFAVALECKQPMTPIEAYPQLTQVDLLSESYRLPS